MFGYRLAMWPLDLPVRPSLHLYPCISDLSRWRCCGIFRSSKHCCSFGGRIHREELKAAIVEQHEWRFSRRQCRVWTAAYKYRRINFTKRNVGLWKHQSYTVNIWNNLNVADGQISTWNFTVKLRRCRSHHQTLPSSSCKNWRNENELQEHKREKLTSGDI